MLSINYIQNYLTDEQVRIDSIYYSKINQFEKKNIENYKEITNLNYKHSNNSDNFNNSDNSDKNNTIKLENYCEKLYNSFDILFNLNNVDYYYNNRLFRNKSSVFTFLNSIFNIGDDFFNIFDEKTRENIIKKFIKTIDNDLFEKNLYNKFNYSKNRKFNKSDIQDNLKNSFQFKNIQKFELIKQYIADYLGINIYVIHVNSTVIDFKKSEYYLSQNFNNSYIKFLPNFILLCENEIYKPILNKNNSIIRYSDNNNIIDKLWKLLDIKIIDNVDILDNKKLVCEEILKEPFIDKIEEKDKKNIFNSYFNESINTNNVSIISDVKYKIDDLKNLKITDIKTLCEENNILLKKNSEKTLKMINKLKEELIEELLLVK